MAAKQKTWKGFSSCKARSEEPAGRADDGEARRVAARAGGAGRWLCLLYRCYHPVLPTRSKANDREHWSGLYSSTVQRRWPWVKGVQDLPWNNLNHTRIGADPGDAEERRATEPRAARPGRAPQDPRGVTQNMPWRRARLEKRELREAKRTSDRENKSKRMEK